MTGQEITILATVLGIPSSITAVLTFIDHRRDTQSAEEDEVLNLKLDNLGMRLEKKIDDSLTAHLRPYALAAVTDAQFHELRRICKQNSIHISLLWSAVKGGTPPPEVED